MDIINETIHWCNQSSLKEGYSENSIAFLNLHVTCMGNLLYLHVLCRNVLDCMRDVAGWNSYHQISAEFSLRPVDAGKLFEIGHDSPLFPVKMYEYCRHLQSVPLLFPHRV